MNINEFPGYKYENEIILNPSGKKVNQINHKSGLITYKMKRYDNKWVHLCESKLRMLTGRGLKLPNDAIKIKGYDNYFIDKKGNVYSFNKTNPDGIIMKHAIGQNGYPRVSFNGRCQEIHTIMANTFIMDGYSKKGLCVLHKDDDKLNCNLDNLCVGTYSRNNKDAYKAKLQSSKKGSYEHGKKSKIRVDWSKVDLDYLISQHGNNMSAIAREIGCSGNALKKHIIKFGR